MQQSMTGYGRDQQISKNVLIKTEVKTLNSKFLDFSPRIPKELAEKEPIIRQMVTDLLIRGKIMLSLEVELISDNNLQIQIDNELFKAYYNKFSELTQSVNDSSDELIKLAFQAPNVVKQYKLDPESLPWTEIQKSIAIAIHQCVEFRLKEGAKLTEKLNEYITAIRKGLDYIEEKDDSRHKNMRSKLQKNINEIKDKVQIDENRFEQELLFYFERLDISEEKTRLKQHLDYFEEVMQKEKNSGKKIGFIAQEIGREINTIGSKANNIEIQQTIVTMKDELEKIKEQNLNIL